MPVSPPENPPSPQAAQPTVANASSVAGVIGSVGCAGKAPATPALRDLDAVLGDLSLLGQAYERAGLMLAPLNSSPSSQANELRAQGSREDALRLRRALLLASGLLRNSIGGVFSGAHQRRRAQVAVFGGTQVGKSTTVNVLAGATRARVHHIAGFTRHPQAFLPRDSRDPDEELFGGNPCSFVGFRRVPQTELASERPDEYSVSPLPEAAGATSISPATASLVLWDAPDCDAVGAAGYQRALVEVLTIADAVLYVTSREKYAINAILEWVVLLQDAGVPVAGVLNMTPPAQQRDILESMRLALGQVRGRGDSKAEPSDESRASNGAAAAAQDVDRDAGTKLPLAAAFEYVPDGDVSLLYGADYLPGERLRRNAATMGARAQADRVGRARRSLGWVAKAVGELAAPALAELEASHLWEQEVATAVDSFLDDYRAGYLDDPSRYDAFTKVGVEILALLDLPILGLQKALTATRTVLGVPARMVAAGAKSLWRSYKATHPGAAGDPPSTAHPAAGSAEAQAITQGHERLLNALARSIAHQRQSTGGTRPFWDSLDGLWQKNLTPLQDDFRREMARHRERHDARVKAVAQAIYAELAKDPVRLNVLRTGRLTADAAAILVAIKTGGIGVHDLVVAPAFMSMVQALSQLLTENYVEGQRATLRGQLLEDTRAFANAAYGERLKALGKEALATAGFGGLDGPALRALPQRVKALESWLAS